MTRAATDLTIVGAGPAGLAAAATAVRLGLRPLVLDEATRPGGQYFRQPSAGGGGATARRGAALADAVREGGGVILQGTEVVDVGRDDVLAARDGVLERFPGPLVLAPGATERVVPLPGWTLPGVVTCGGAQALAKAHGVLVGRRVVVAGSGPFLLPVAAELVSLGADVVAIVEAQHLGARAAGRIAQAPQRLTEGLRYALPLLRRRTLVLRGSAVTRIDGVERPEQVIIQRLDRDGVPVPGRARRVACDAVCLSDGFLPSTELAELAGFGLRWDPLTRTWAAQERPPDGARATGMLCVGSALRALGGAQLAQAQGALAAWAVAGELGASDRRTAGERSRVAARARRHARFAAALERTYPTRPGWYARTTPATIVCRCEDVTAEQIVAAARDGGGDVSLVKRWTRAGMGLCQGRTCGASVAELTAAAVGRPASEVGRLRAQPPLRPTALTVLAAQPLAKESSRWTRHATS